MDERLGDVLTIDELAAYLGVPKSTLYKVVRGGKTPSRKIRRHWCSRKGTIDRWMDERRAVQSI